MYNKEEILRKVDILYNMWKKGSLGGEVMPEDANPHLEKSSMANYLYFTSAYCTSLKVFSKHILGLNTKLVSSSLYVFNELSHNLYEFL